MTDSLIAARPHGSSVHGNRWTKDAILDEIRSYHQAHGVTPAAELWRRKGPWPSYNAVRRHFGKWSLAVEAAGFTRPQRGIWITSRCVARGPYKGAAYYRRPTVLSLDRAFSPSNRGTLYDLIPDVTHDEWEDALLDRLDHERVLAEIAAGYAPLERFVILAAAGTAGAAPRLNDAERWLAATPGRDWVFSMLDESRGT